MIDGSVDNDGHLMLSLTSIKTIRQQHCLEVALRLHHVGVVDETRRIFRHYGRQYERFGASRRSATRRCGSQR